MKSILVIVQIIVSLLLIGGILLQQRGGGLSQVFGGGSGAYRTRRGMEKGIFWSTIVLAVLFLAVALASVAVR